jgi:hypothetical protein
MTLHHENSQSFAVKISLSALLASALALVGGVGGIWAMKVQIAVLETGQNAQIQKLESIEKKMDEQNKTISILASGLAVEISERKADKEQQRLLHRGQLEQ